MTQRSEAVRMSFYERIERDGLTSLEVERLFKAEMVRYRGMLRVGFETHADRANRRNMSMAAAA